MMSQEKKEVIHFGFSVCRTKPVGRQTIDSDSSKRPWIDPLGCSDGSSLPGKSAHLCRAGKCCKSLFPTSSRGSPQKQALPPLLAARPITRVKPLNQLPGAMLGLIWEKRYCATKSWKKSLAGANELNWGLFD